jgi:hypothetical protein
VHADVDSDLQQPPLGRIPETIQEGIGKRRERSREAGKRTVEFLRRAFNTQDAAKARAFLPAFLGYFVVSSGCENLELQCSKGAPKRTHIGKSKSIRAPPSSMSWFSMSWFSMSWFSMSWYVLIDEFTANATHRLPIRNLLLDN